jgi:hypothetical protein
MLPSKNNETTPCNPISSNCVTWQGPDIPCINLCNGDSVSDVVAKLATELCNIIDATCQCNPDLTGLDISCMTDETPDGLVATLQEIINFTCNLAEEGGQKNPIDLNLAKCLRYRDDQGNLVTQLPIDQWATYVGNALCDVISSIRTLSQNFENLSDRVATLEKCVLPCKPQQEADFLVISSCLFEGREVKISQLVLALESKFCAQTGATGNTGVINTTISAQTVTGKDETARGEGTYSSEANWVDNPTNLAESVRNLWVVAGDYKSAIANLSQALPTGCEAADFVFTYNTIDSDGNGLVDQINLNFQGTKIPDGFTDCGGVTVVTVTDSDGASITQNINVSGLVNSTSGVNIDISTLNRFASVNVSIPFCVGDDSSQCADRQQVIIPLSAPCPSTVNLTPLPDSFSVIFSNTLGNSISYQIVATSQTTGSILGKTTVNNPGSTVNYTFPGATPGDTYDVVITLYSGKTPLNTCPAESVTIPGVICNDVEVITGSTDAVEATDVYLGLYDSGLTTTRYWYDAEDGLIKAEDAGRPVACDSPILTSPTMDYLGTPGDVAVTVSYGTEPAPASAEISYSIDGINYLGLTSGADGLRTISTGATSGSVYIKVETTCTGPVLSVPTIIRYDFGTEVWTTLQSPQECADTSLTSACPSGVEVARQYLECGVNSYTVFGGSAESYWFYVGKRVVGSVTTYIYAGWDNSTDSVRSVVECCACPTFLLSDPIQILCGHDGDSVDITIPYVLGAGEPAMTVISNPVLGTVSQGAIANQFTYTTVNPNREKDYADTFQVQLQPTVPGTGNCSLATMTVQVQLISCNTKLTYTDQDVYVFINTNGFSTAFGGQLIAGFGELETAWNSAFGYTGNIYFIPTDDKRWLGYLKAVVDNGASWNQSADLAWQAFENLPTSWPGGSGVGNFKNAAMVMIFSNDSSGVYHDTTLAAGYGSGLTAQPTVSYKEDYDSLIDMLTGTQSSTWAQTLGISQNQFPEGLSVVLNPFMVNGSGSADAANILQMISAYTAELITPSKYGIKTAADVTSYILQGLAASMPYSGATTPTNTITQLFEKSNFGMLALLDQEYSATVFNEIKDGVGQFGATMDRAIKGCADAYPAATIPALSVYEVRDCTTSDTYFVTITDQSCGTISNGTIVKLYNPGAGFAPGDGRANWDTLTNKCLTVIDNCSGTASELATDLDSTYDVCGTCTP